MRPIRRIIVHHAAASATLQQIDEWHRARGFDGVGYHFVIEPTGQAAAGRPVARVGAHSKGANSDSIGVCMGVDAREPIPPVVWDGMRYLVASLVRTYGLTVADVYGHRETGNTPTLCPAVDPQTIRDAVAATLSEDIAWVPGTAPPVVS